MGLIPGVGTKILHTAQHSPPPPTSPPLPKNNGVQRTLRCFSGKYSYIVGKIEGYTLEVVIFLNKLLILTLFMEMPRYFLKTTPTVINQIKSGLI